MNYKHYILTRFNYPDDYPHLEERFKIFYNFTKPSFEAQTNTNFTWFILINPHHEKLFQPFKNINVELVPKWDVYQSPTDYLLTSRVDCDDVLHQDYVSTIQELFLQDQSTRVIDGPGYRYVNKTKEVYTYYTRYSKRTTSPFSTLVAPFRDKLTVMCEKHGSLPQRFKVQFHDKKLWLQHIHDYNILMRGVGEKKINLDLKNFNINL
jgi:hypothetical protein